MLSRAIHFAARCHAGQKDRGGEAYILHPLRVMETVRHRIGYDEKYLTVAVCHDAIEDAYSNIIEEGFSRFSAEVTDDPIVLASLRLMTKEIGADYFDYIRNIVGNIMSPNLENLIAKQVKIADIEDNTRITRLKGLKQKDLERLKKYHISYCYLTGKTDKLLDLGQ